jgi:hypothetical protein
MTDRLKLATLRNEEVKLRGQYSTRKGTWQAIAKLRALGFDEEADALEQNAVLFGKFRKLAEDLSNLTYTIGKRSLR